MLNRESAQKEAAKADKIQDFLSKQFTEISLGGNKATSSPQEVAPQQVENKTNSAADFDFGP